MDFLKKVGQKVSNLFSRTGPTYTSPHASGYNPAGAAALAGQVKAKPTVTPPMPAAPVIAAATQPSVARVQSGISTPTPVNPPSFGADTTKGFTEADLRPTSKGALERKRSQLEQLALSLRQPTEQELKAQERLSLAEQALGRLGATRDTANYDLQYTNRGGVFGGGVNTVGGQIDNDYNRNAIGANYDLNSAKSEYERLRTDRTQTLADLQTIQSLTAPDVLGTPQVDKATGDVYAYIQNPDGTISTQNIGNVGVDDSFDIQSVIRNEATGQAFAVGIQNGQLVTRSIEGTAGLAPTAAMRNGTLGLGGISLTPGQESEIADTNTLISMLDSASASIAGGAGGGIGGFGLGSIKQFLAKNFGAGSPQEVQLRNQIGNIAGTIAKLRGGTSFTESEKALLETYSPTINDSALVVNQKIADLKSFLTSKRQSLINVASGNYTGTTASKTDVDPLGLGLN